MSKPNSGPTDERVFGVDGNFYLHRVVHTQVFEPKDEQLSQASRFLAMICKDALAVKARRILVAFDGWSIFRYRLYSEYKAGRGGGSDVYAHLEFIKSFLVKAGITVAHKRAFEADDVLCSLASQWPNVVIGCRDKDAYQYVRRGVALYDSSAKPEPVRLGPAEVLKLVGLEPAQCLDYQTLIGDKIDNVPQLMRPSEAIAGLTKHGSIKRWAAKDRKARKLFSSKVEALNLNRKLVRLRPDLKIEVPPIKWSDDEKLTKAYFLFKAFAGAKSRSLF